MKLKHKYLHVNINKNGLFIYCDNKKNKAKIELFLSTMDNECCVDSDCSLYNNIVINLETLINNLSKE